MGFKGQLLCEVCTHGKASNVMAVCTRVARYPAYIRAPNALDTPYFL